MSSSERTDRATALITGASSGIGYQYARQLAARGYDLLIVSNDAEGIANSAAEIRKQYGVRVTPLYRDLVGRKCSRRPVSLLRRRAT